MPDTSADRGAIEAYTRSLTSPEAQKARLRRYMGEGDSLVEDRPGHWMVARSMRRNPNVSSLNRAGQIADSLGAPTVDRRRSRLAAGFASQWYGLDDAGNPAYGPTPGIVHETKALGLLPSMLMRSGMDGIMQKLGVDTNAGYYKFLQQATIPEPQGAADSAAKTDLIHQRVREDMRLRAPRGFEENAQESLGVMLGQLPIPGGPAKQASSEASALARAGRTAENASEWFTPTVRPTISNYSSGALLGGTIGAAADSEDVPTVLPSDQEGMSYVRPVYSDGSVGYSGSPEDRVALEELLAAEEGEGYAKGGKVQAVSEWLEKFKGTPDEPDYPIEEFMKAHRFNPQMSDQEIELLRTQNRLGYGLPASDHQEFLSLIERHAIPIQGGQTFRGIRTPPKKSIPRHLEETSHLPLYTSLDPDHAKIYASSPVPRPDSGVEYNTMMDEWRPTLLDIRPQGARAFPHFLSPENEVVFPQGYEINKSFRPWLEAFDESDEVGPGLKLLLSEKPRGPKR